MGLRLGYPGHIPPRAAPGEVAVLPFTYPAIFFLCLQRIQRKEPRAETCILWRTNTEIQAK